jgi:FkbM family methyltransferase
MPYSQGGEEETLAKIFSGYTRSDGGRPILLDVGAFDGKLFSNSLALLEKGWRGVLIEPSPAAFIALRQTHAERPNLTLVNAVLGFDKHLIPFHDCPDCIGTTVPEHAEKWAKGGSKFTPHWAPQITFEQLQNQLPHHYDLILIDTEGTSTDLFLNILNANQRPRAWVIEHDGRNIEIANVARQQGYSVNYLDGNNIILAK